MLKRIGVENRLDLALLLSLILLVAVTPLGKEATRPVVLGLYRTLLIFVTVAATVRVRNFKLPQVSLPFLASVTVVILAMYGSVVLRAGSHFDGVYNFYQNVLFLTAFIALASFHRTRTSQWKSAILALVVVIDLVYLAAAWAGATRPLMGPFVNPNYFASYLLVGFAICTTFALFARSLKVRIGLAAAGMILFYGIGQTSSRGVFLSVLAVLGLGLFRYARQRRIPLLRIAVVLILFVVIAAAANPSLIQKFSDRGQRDIYNYERTQIWMETLSMIATHPITGVGLTRYYFVSKLFTPAVEGAIGRYQRWPNIAHSEYLQYTAELGVPVALLMFGIGIFLFRLAWQRAETVTTESRIFQEAALLTAAGLGTHALVDNNWTVPVVAAGLAAISMADILPYRSWTSQIAWPPVRGAALGVLIAGVFIQSVAVPTVGLYMNEAGHQAYIAGDFDRAEKLHRLAIGILPDHPTLLDNVGMVYFEQYLKTRQIEYLDRAEILFRDSMAANPSFDLPAGHLETALFQRLSGNPAKDQPVHALIVAADQSRLRANPYNPFARKNLAEALYNLGQKQEAIAELQKTVDLEPNYIQANVRLAQLLDETGQASKAEEYRSKAVAVADRFKDQQTSDAFETMLLNRPVAIAGKP